MQSTMKLYSLFYFPGIDDSACSYADSILQGFDMYKYTQIKLFLACTWVYPCGYVIAIVVHFINQVQATYSVVCCALKQVEDRIEAVLSKSQYASLQ